MHLLLSSRYKSGQQLNDVHAVHRVRAYYAVHASVFAMRTSAFESSACARPLATKRSQVVVDSKNSSVTFIDNAVVHRLHAF
jgi:hypothetical protein